MFEQVLKEHMPYIPPPNPDISEDPVCECGQRFPDVVGGRDPRGLWVEHVAPLLLDVLQATLAKNMGMPWPSQCPVD